VPAEDLHVSRGSAGDKRALGVVGVAYAACERRESSGDCGAVSIVQLSDASKILTFFAQAQLNTNL
jgi:hypothetical protein